MPETRQVAIHMATQAWTMPPAAAPVGKDMCYFITIGFKENAWDELQQIVPQGMKLDRTTIPWLSKLMGEDLHLFVLTSGGCSCELYREAGGTGEDEQDRVDRLSRKYAKKGWSGAKIQRAIGSHGTKPDDFIGLRKDVCELVASSAERARRICIVVHFFGGDIASERFSVAESRAITARGLRRGKEPVAVDTMTWVKVS